MYVAMKSSRDVCKGTRDQQLLSPVETAVIKHTKTWNGIGILDVRMIEV